MESPQILIDTSILIDYFRKRHKDKTLLYSLSFTYRFAISTVTEFEFFAGLSAIHLKFTNTLFANFLILPFDSTCTQTASEIYKNLKSKNQLISPPDIFIAATAISHNLSLLTLNKEHFEREHGLKLFHIK
ncbi:MAG TPA: type II toxin-antitoxin system VapC family toxin [Candidatus Wunengus sp. YC65]|uniref:type II toxin-antitoxin system VapC family toxin n=1 Tax=Candidatus Wunengus sp. YC65 TaxID=3367701 RepID=UPI004028847C